MNRTKKNHKYKNMDQNNAHLLFKKKIHLGKNDFFFNRKITKTDYLYLKN